MDKRLEAAIAAAKAAGEVALRYFRSQLTVEYKDDLSPVTRADRECEQRIVEILHREFPDYGVVGKSSASREERTLAGSSIRSTGPRILSAAFRISPRSSAWKRTARWWRASSMLRRSTTCSGP